MRDFLKAIFTDGEWDGDASKFFGFIIVVAGIVGFFLSIPSFEWVIGFGAALIATGKFSGQG